MLVRSSQSISDVYSQDNKCVSVTHKLTVHLEVQPHCSQRRVSQSQFEEVWSTRKGCPCQHLESSVLEFLECPLSAKAGGRCLSTPFPLYSGDAISWAPFQKSLLWVTESTTWHLLCVGCQQPVAEAEKQEGPEHSLESFAESEAGSSVCSLEWRVLSVVPLPHPVV